MSMCGECDARKTRLDLELADPRAVARVGSGVWREAPVARGLDPAAEQVRTESRGRGRAPSSAEPTTQEGLRPFGQGERPKRIDEDGCDKRRHRNDQLRLKLVGVSR
jgi:hypothetical protein